MNRMGPTVGEWGEKRLVQAIRGVVGAGKPGQIGVGDDAAVFDIPDGCQVVLSTDRVPSDLLSRRLGLMGAKDLGRYLVEVNVSDIVAMGGEPVAVVLNLGLASEARVEDLLDLVRGATHRGLEVGASIVGGDTKMTSVDSFVAAAVGAVPEGQAIRRSTAVAGDRVFVSGQVGGFGAALSYYFRKNQKVRLPDELEAHLLERLVRPTARTDLVTDLRSMQCSACIDITDGLGESIRELERAGSCSFDLELTRLPVDPAVYVVAELLGLDWVELLFGIGLDLELLGCTKLTRLPKDFTDIGVARSQDSGPSRVLDTTGKWRTLPGKGWQHFAGDAQDFVT